MIYTFAVTFWKPPLLLWHQTEVTVCLTMSIAWLYRLLCRIELRDETSRLWALSSPFANLPNLASICQVGELFSNGGVNGYCCHNLSGHSFTAVSSSLFQDFHCLIGSTLDLSSSLLWFVCLRLWFGFCFCFFLLLSF